MARATINHFISALLSPLGSLNILRSAVAKRDNEGGVAISRTTHFADARIEWRGQSYLLSLPLTVQGASMAQRSSVRLRTMRSNLLLEYRVLPSEMSFVDSLGRPAQSDLLIEELPAGRELHQCIGELDPLRLYGAIDQLECEFARLTLSHSNLKMENLIIDEDYTLYPLRLHYATLQEESNGEFDALRQAVAQRLCVECPPPKGGDVRAKEPQPNKMYGYLNVGNPFEGLVVFQSQEGYGYLDAESGEVVIPPRYVWAGDMREGRAEVETGEGMGLIDAKGRYIIEPHYQIVEFDPRTGLSTVRKNDKWTTLDYEGRPLESAVEAL